MSRSHWRPSGGPEKNVNRAEAVARSATLPDQVGKATVAPTSAHLEPLRAVAQTAGASNSTLADRVSLLIEQSREVVAVQTNAVLTLRNWYIGQMIHVEVLGEQRATYGSKIGATLSHQLSWSHFKVLLRVEKPEARAFYIEQVVTPDLHSWWCFSFLSWR